jgi:hypothetical protein
MLMDNETAKPATSTTPVPVAATNHALAGDASDKSESKMQAPASGDEVKAQELVPGGELIGRGIHIRPRQPYELKEVLFDDLKAVLLDREHQPTSSYYRYYSQANNKTYIVPHQCEINGSPPLPANQSAAETLIEESWERFSNQLTFNVSASVNAPLVTIDPSALHATNLKSEEDSSYAMRNAFVPLFSIYLPSVPSSIDALDNAAPAEHFDTETDEQAKRKRDEYNKIFDRFGTHYIKSAWVGGKASLVFIVSKSSKLSEQQIRIGIQASFGGQGYGTASSEQRHTMEILKNNSSCRVFGSGGDKIKLAQLSKLDESAYNQWLDSVKIFPEVIQLEVAGIWTLVKDPIAAEALKSAYIEESHFVPLKAIVPIGEWFYFLDKDGYVFKFNPRPALGEHKAKDSPPFDQVTLQKALDQNPALKGLKVSDFEQSQIASSAPGALRQLSERNQQFQKYLPVLISDPRYRPFTYPDSAISLSGFGNSLDDTIDLFEGGRCLRVDWRKGTVVAGYPMAINKAWPGVDFDRIDATVAVANANRVYFFRGDEYIRVEYDGWHVIGNPPRNSIEGHWPGVIFERLDTAFYFGDSKVYFFSGDQYIRYDLALGRTDPGYPRYLNSNYVEDWNLFE